MNKPSSKMVVVIGQAPARPGSKHEKPGAYLRPWLYRAGITEEAIASQFVFAALMGEFPGSKNGGHLPPTQDQINVHRPCLEGLLRSTQPRIVVPVGRLAIASLFGQQPLDTTIGRVYELDPYDVLGYATTLIPLPHPSGRSTWVHKYPQLLEKALAHLAKELIPEGS